MLGESQQGATMHTGEQRILRQDCPAATDARLWFSSCLSTYRCFTAVLSYLCSLALGRNLEKATLT